MSHRLQPESVFTAVICVAIMVGSLLFCYKDAHSDELYANGKLERAVCQTYWSEPVMVICRSETQTCTLYPESGQVECIQK